MRHRLQNDADWWSVPDEELEEVNAGNVVFLNLGADGVFTIQVVGQPCRGGVAVQLRCPSGRLFLGAIHFDPLATDEARNAFAELVRV